MKSTYSEKLKSPKWQKKRLEILNRDEFKCRHCKKDEDQLHVHHIIYIDGLKPWEYDNNQLITLCEKCHEYLHKSHGISTVTNEGFLNAFNFIQSYPRSLFDLRSIDNHKGMWTIKFTEDVDLISCVMLISKLHGFIKECDGWIEMKYYSDKGGSFNMCDLIKPV